MKDFLAYYAIHGCMFPGLLGEHSVMAHGGSVNLMEDAGENNNIFNQHRAEIKSLEGQIAYSEEKIEEADEKWVKKEYQQGIDDAKKRIKELQEILDIYSNKKARGGRVDEEGEIKFRIIEEIRPLKDNPNAEWVRVSSEHNGETFIVGYAIDLFGGDKEKAIERAKQEIRLKIKASSGVGMSFEDFKKLPINWSDKRSYGKGVGMMYNPSIRYGEERGDSVSYGSHEFSTSDKTYKAAIDQIYKNLYDQYIEKISEKHYENGGGVDGHYESSICMRKEVSSSNTIYCEVEEDFGGEYSVIVYDEFSPEEGGIWIEKFAKTKEEAKELAEKMFNKAVNNYNH